MPIQKKRKRQPDDTCTGRPAPDSAAQAHSPQDGGYLREGESVRERARPYLLAVAEMPLNALDTTWSIGRNRSLDPGHVRELKEMFGKVGVERRATENRIIGLCRAEQVRRMRARSDQQGVCSFLDWAETNAGTKVELMAGQHRIQALREYVKDMAASEAAAVLWWTCELYDKDRLPHDLNVKLRVNRRDLSLPDNHGQIWTQLVSVAPKGASDRLEERVGVDIKLVEALRLGGEKNFPTRRLVTLWNHKRWRDMATRWCSTRLGLETFNISVFEWMSSLRLDDYWFAKLGAVIETLQALALSDPNALGHRDWQHIAAGLRGAGRTAREVESVFYKTDRSRRVRVEGLLASLDDDGYASVCRAITSNTLAFPDMKKLVRSSRIEAHVMVRVLQHVIAWIDLDSALAVDEVNPKAKNKPPVRDNLAAALEKLNRSRGAGNRADDASLRLQERVLNFARDNMTEFRAAEARALLDDDVSLAFCADVFKSVDSPELHTPDAMLAIQRKIEETIATHAAQIMGKDKGGLGMSGIEAGGLPCLGDTSLRSSPEPSSDDAPGDGLHPPANKHRQQRRQASKSSHALSNTSGLPDHDGKAISQDRSPENEEDAHHSATEEGVGDAGDPERDEQEQEGHEAQDGWLSPEGGLSPLPPRKGLPSLPSSVDRGQNEDKRVVPRWKRLPRAGIDRH
ncbi:hypothetical protein COL26b_014397 [Colletotrichum chrysophilum]|uniref:uncharacterized protein n=1 Tax=Colletotrichum chrysophilum TaxID=1836956 RepID=UPI002301E829|nr:uncharacterized protein COL26b_014397 [Colletotrichum chrysophilum]KAJ0359240.1 hypothetical protein COL26b_014397 [Colletotrichum chrysophilum]